jgi:hypothetical protein
MNPTPERQPHSDELLRAIGRNVVNFQYLEATLRSMIPALSNHGTATEWQARYIKVTRKHKKSSLGDLADEFHDRVFGSAVDPSTLIDESLSEPSMAFALRLESTPESVAQQKRALRMLVTERNRLIHSSVLTVDLDSPEQCREECAKLDEQNDRIRQQLADLNAIRKGWREASEEFQRFIQSGEFVAMLRGGQDDA